MKKVFASLFACSVVMLSFAQTPSTLTVEKIMRDPKSWIGTSPSNIQWAEDNTTIYFSWNPDKNPGDSLYKVTASGGKPVHVSPAERRNLIPGNAVYTKDRTRALYSRNGDIFLHDIKSNKRSQLTNTVGNESNPVFSSDEQKVFFLYDNNLYSLHLKTNLLTQITDIRSGAERKDRKRSEQDEWLYKDEAELIQVLKERKTAADARKDMNDRERVKRPKTFYLDGRQAFGLQISPDERYVTFVLRKNADNAKNTDVPNYVTESSYTENISARPKVGSAQGDQWLMIYSIAADTFLTAKTDHLPGLDIDPEYKKEYASDASSKEKKKKREVTAQNAVWSENGKYAVVTFRSKDNKDRWICLLNPATGESTVLNHQHDEAWIGGPGIGGSFGGGSLGWMPDNVTIWFQSEETGYSHLYTVNVETKIKTALTSGNFEVSDPQLSRDKKRWYFQANITHPGDNQFCTMPLSGGKIETLTSQAGSHDVTLSPDNTRMAILYSSSNQPWELYVMDNPVTGKKGVMKQLTSSQTDEFKSYAWRKPDVITFPARDGAQVHARLYKPEASVKNGAAVIFVHGAGYLQNAHRWWSSYFREYMFHNLLTDLGYTVLDIDYRGSAGYGRDWRTGIYRHMGGKDLTDHVDGARFLVTQQGVDAKRIGIYGGSYGGFITLMAMFTEPDTFAAGAALRSVTDWAHYNHGYTSNILNTPVEDSVAYRKSSPIYYAEGLKGALLMCHGMVDTNVHFQDIVRLTQRLIELKKENWELAVYPMEDHGFVEPSSWTDEYKRILKLFETNLRK
jgi:dipeptidyl aminopeptidase/acylaminoacyl peptidase